jgi:hypothetical protein
MHDCPRRRRSWRLARRQQEDCLLETPVPGVGISKLPNEGLRCSETGLIHAWQADQRTLTPRMASAASIGDALVYVIAEGTSGSSAT